MTPEEKPRRTLREVLNEGLRKEVGEKGIRCPNCGCADLRVKITRRGNGAIRRTRVCAHCGREVLTFETTK